MKETSKTRGPSSTPTPGRDGGADAGASAANSDWQRRADAVDDPVQEIQQAIDSVISDMELGQRACGSATVRERQADVRLPVLREQPPSETRSRYQDLDPVGRDAFLYTVIESLDHPFLVINADDYSISIANKAARAVGPADAVHCFELTHHRGTPCDSKEHPCPVVEMRRTGKPVRVEHIHLSKDGTARNVEVHSHPVFDVQGRLAQIIEYSVDITDRKKAEAMVLETRDLMVFAMAKLTESRDPETGSHLERMRAYSMLLAQELATGGPYAKMIDKAFLDDLFRASPLHDIGKVGIPDAILLKPGQLNSEEFEIMKHHATIGALALEKICAESKCGTFLCMAAEIARSHHERFNGAGYPDGLEADAIPLSARIVAVADVFDALTSARVYKQAFEPATARLMIESDAGRHFDPVIVEAFRARWEEFLEVRSRMMA